MQTLVLRERTCYFPTGLNSSFGSFPRAVTGKFKNKQAPSRRSQSPSFYILHVHDCWKEDNPSSAYLAASGGEGTRGRTKSCSASEPLQWVRGCFRLAHASVFALARSSLWVIADFLPACEGTERDGDRERQRDGRKERKKKAEAFPGRQTVSG